jgi:hypothetical protein
MDSEQQGQERGRRRAAAAGEADQRADKPEAV